MDSLLSRDSDFWVWFVLEVLVRRGWVEEEYRAMEGVMRGWRGVRRTEAALPLARRVVWRRREAMMFFLRVLCFLLLRFEEYGKV